MDETRKFMARVIASILTLGPAGYAASLASPPLARQNPTQTRPQSSAKKAVDEDTLRTVEFQVPCHKVGVEPKSVDVLAKELPNIERKTLEAAIKSLLDEGELVRLGDGTKESPYRYYRAVGCGG